MSINNIVKSNEVRDKIDQLKAKPNADEKKRNKSLTNRNTNRDELGIELNISEEALALLKGSKVQLENNNKILEEIKEQKENKLQDYYTKLSEFLDEAHKSSEGAGEAYKTLGRCIKIAMRIVSGDNVPAKDAHYLMENNKELYSMAMNMRMIKDDPKDLESVLDEEKDSNYILGTAKVDQLEIAVQPYTEETPIILS